MARTCSLPGCEPGGEVGPSDEGVEASCAVEAPEASFAIERECENGNGCEMK